MESIWDKLVNVQMRLNYLDDKQARIMSARFREIHEGAVGPDEAFTEQIAAVRNELKELWPEKRYLLSQLNVSEKWSWLSPRITNLADYRGLSRTSGNGQATLTLQ